MKNFNSKYIQRDGKSIEDYSNLGPLPEEEWGGERDRVGGKEG